MSHWCPANFFLFKLMVSGVCVLVMESWLTQWGWITQNCKAWHEDGLFYSNKNGQSFQSLKQGVTGTNFLL
jgi:hypothetical protein